MDGAFADRAGARTALSVSIQGALVLILALFASGAALAAQPDAAANFAGRIDIGGGRKLYLQCSGTGRPTVVLEAGYRVRSDYWTENEAKPPATSVYPGIAGFTRVCAYDRPGTVIGVGVKDRSRSDVVPMPRTALNVVDDLHALLRAAHIPRPVVLVGHSFGGLFTRLYAYKYPADVAGLVLVDALIDARDGLTPAQYREFVRLNVARPKELDSYFGYETIPFELAFDALYRLQAKASLRPMPLVVLTRGLPQQIPDKDVPAGFSRALERVWRAKQNKLVDLEPGSRQIIATRSEHYIMLTQPKLIVDAARTVVDAVRRGQHRVR